MNIAVTGYYGTGSSAVIDFLCEFSTVSIAMKREYEHYAILGKNALLDLEMRLFGENTNYMIRDYAINEFIDEMNRQNKYNFGWFGSYKKHFGNKFIDIVNKFVDSISEPKPCRSFTQVKKIIHTPFKAVAQIGARILVKRPIYDLGRVYVYDKKPIRFLTVDHEEFMAASKQFISEYLNLFKNGNNIIVFDHLLLPEQAKIINKFFDNDFKLIIVDRDPRDMYLLSEHYWNTLKFGKQPGIYPNSMQGFCNHWKQTHPIKQNTENVLFVQFEDLIYNYEKTAEQIMKFCGLKIEDHVDKCKIFDPKKSINNTQIFELNETYKNEVEYLAQHLPESLYTFPYSNKHDGEIF